MLDVEDFDAVFQGLNYSDGLSQQISECKHALGGKTFFERLLDLLKIKGRSIYPPKNDNQLHELHQRIITSDTSLHNKHCLVFYILKDLSARQHESVELATKFARDVHLEKRFWTFIEGLWALDHMEFRTAVEHLTHPSIIPTFPDEIIYILLRRKDKAGAIGVQSEAQDDILPLAYFNCAQPPLEDERTREEFAKYLSSRDVTEAYYWIHTRPAYEQHRLLELMVGQALDTNTWDELKNIPYSRQEKALELVGLPLNEEEEEFIEKYLTEGKGRTLPGAQDTVLMRQVAMGRLTDVASDNTTKGSRHDGVNWETLKDGVKRGLGPRASEDGFVV